MKRTEHWKDIAYAVVAELGDNKLYIKVKVLNIFGYDENNAVFYRLQDSTSPVPTEDIEKAEVFLQGSIKWDGCSNLQFKDGDCLLHFCDKKDAMNVGVLMGRLYDLAHEMVLPYINAG